MEVIVESEGLEIISGRERKTGRNGGILAGRRKKIGTGENKKEQRVEFQVTGCVFLDWDNSHIITPLGLCSGI